MLNSLRRLLRQGVPPPGKQESGIYARPVAANNNRVREDRRKVSPSAAVLPDSVPVDRRKGPRRAAEQETTTQQVVAIGPLTEVADAVSTTFAHTGTDGRVVPIEAARRNSSAFHPAGESHEVARLNSGAVVSTTSLRASSTGMASKPSAETPGGDEGYLLINSESELRAAIGCDWRGMLHGIVHPDLAEECVVLDLMCGQVVIIVTEQASQNQHLDNVERKIKEDWLYVIQNTFILPKAVVSSIYKNISAATDAGRAPRLRQSDCLIQVYDDIVAMAIAAKTSDVHFETFGTVGRVRIRVYGALRVWLLLPPALIEKSLSSAFHKRYKTKTTNKTNFSVEHAMAFITTQHVKDSIWHGRFDGGSHGAGYLGVMRLLDSTARIEQIKTLAELGFNESQQELINMAVSRRYGTFFVIGPTGGGKSTTLRSILIYLPNSKNLSIQTIESPVEYTMPGIFQFNSPIDPNMTLEEMIRAFNANLRNALRRDPDVLMVGEIRDHESAEQAIEFGMTGHQSFTSMHGDGGIDGLFRLATGKLNIPSTTLGHKKVVNAALFQKVLPKLCEDCKLPADHPEHGLSEAKRALLRTKYELDPDRMFVANPCGCDKCAIGIVGLRANGTKGVVMAAEIFIPNLELSSLISQDRWQEAEQRWREQRVDSFAGANMVGKTGFENGLWHLSNGHLSLFDLEDGFESIESYEIVPLVKGKA